MTTPSFGATKSNLGFSNKTSTAGFKSEPFQVLNKEPTRHTDIAFALNQLPIFAVSDISKKIRIFLYEEENTQSSKKIFAKPNTDLPVITTDAIPTRITFRKESEDLYYGQVNGHVFSVIAATRAKKSVFALEGPICALKWNSHETRLFAASYGGHMLWWDPRSNDYKDYVHDSLIYDMDTYDKNVVFATPHGVYGINLSYDPTKAFKICPTEDTVPTCISILKRSNGCVFGCSNGAVFQVDIGEDQYQDLIQDVSQQGCPINTIATIERSGTGQWVLAGGNSGIITAAEVTKGHKENKLQLNAGSGPVLRICPGNNQTFPSAFAASYGEDWIHGGYYYRSHKRIPSSLSLYTPPMVSKI